MSLNKRYNWTSYIEMNFSILRIMGFWPTGTDCYQCGLYGAYTLILTSFFIIGHISFQAINIYFISDDLEAIAASSYILLVEILGAFKAYYLIKNTTLLKDTLRILDSEWFQPRTGQQLKLIEPNIRFWKNIYNTFLVLCFGSNVFWAMFPFLDRSSDGRRLPFLAWYPYNAQASPFYEITYVYQIISISYLTLVHVNVDTLIAAFNMYIGTQIDMLIYSLRNFKIDESAHSNDTSEKLIKFIKHHQEIIRFVENCKKLFSWILFLQFFISSTAIGITLFQLSLPIDLKVVPLSSEFYSLVSYEIAIVLELFMYCWFGNEMKIKSDNLPYAVFEADWTNFSPKSKKILLFFTLKLLEPIQLSALNLFDLSLETFMKILKTAWSYFALLHQINSIN